METDIICWSNSGFFTHNNGTNDSDFHMSVWWDETPEGVSILTNLTNTTYEQDRTIAVLPSNVTIGYDGCHLCVRCEHCHKTLFSCKSRYVEYQLDGDHVTDIWDHTKEPCPPWSAPKN